MDRLVVMFGGSGFLGRYVAQRLLAAGARVRFAERDPRRAWFLKPQGGLGQTQFVAADVTRPDSVARAVSGADAVINLVGSFDDMDAVNGEGAGNVAKAAAAAGVPVLLHVSALGADAGARSAYARSKAAGEAAVRAAFPHAIVLRPSIIFGREDKFINRFAGLIRTLPVTPVLRGGARFQPVYVGDVADVAVRAIADSGAHAGQTYALGGPQVLTMTQIHEWIAREIGRTPRLVELPDIAGATLARLTGWAPGAPINWDQWLMLQHDNVVPAGEPGLAAFGVAPTPLASVAPGWLVQYRRHGRFGGLRETAQSR